MPNNWHQPDNLHYAPFCVFAGAHFYTKNRSVTVSAVPGVMWALLLGFIFLKSWVLRSGQSSIKHQQ
jgi:hypothetical protein